MCTMALAAWLLATAEQLEDLIGNREQLLKLELNPLSNAAKAIVSNVHDIGRQLKVKALDLR